MIIPCRFVGFLQNFEDAPIFVNDRGPYGPTFISVISQKQFAQHNQIFGSVLDKFSVIGWAPNGRSAPFF